jgi:LPS export ABC transporter protein LptC
MMATAAAVAFILFSCKGKNDGSDSLNLNEVPLQTIDNMFAVQTKNSVVVMRMEADLMERFENDTASRETFPKGVAMYSYTDEGLLETTIFADNALHETEKNGRDETWAAFGNVVIQNVIKREVMETDTLYWDRGKGELYTDCYVRMYSPDGFMQGYGMRSDDKARNAIILRPFNSFGVVVQDTTVVMIDSVNFIGPFPKK